MFRRGDIVRCNRTDHLRGRYVVLGLARPRTRFALPDGRVFDLEERWECLRTDKMHSSEPDSGVYASWGDVYQLEISRLTATGERAEELTLPEGRDQKSSDVGTAAPEQIAAAMRRGFEIARENEEDGERARRPDDTETHLRFHNRLRRELESELERGEQ